VVRWHLRHPKIILLGFLRAVRMLSRLSAACQLTPIEIGLTDCLLL